MYLDSAATTLQKPPSVAQAVAKAVNTLASPGRGGHKPAMEAADTAFRCRLAAGKLLGVGDPERVVFTFNATHALNIAIHTLVKPGDTVVISGWEHNAVTRPLHALRAKVRVAAGGLFDTAATLEGFREAVTQEVKCVICTQTSNVFGMILPIPQIAQLCREKGVPLIVDAAQSAGCLTVEADRWGASFVALPGHKGLYGPQGTGLLLCGEGVMPEPLLRGGTGSASVKADMPDFLPDRLEAGTHNIAGIAGLLAGIKYVSHKTPAVILAHEQGLVTQLRDGLNQLPGVEVFAAHDPKDQGGVLSLRLHRWDCEEAGEWLGSHAVAVRAGLHCAPTAHRSAGTLDTGTVRVSFSAFNTKQEVARFLDLVETMVRKKA